jgi:hypothetical protein
VDMDLEEIEKYINTKATKLKLEKGEIYKLRFLGCEIVSGMYGKQMQIEFVDLADNQKKKFWTTSRILLKMMFQTLKIQEGEEIYLSRHGDRFETVYDCRRAAQAKHQKNEIKK